jgi:hypothetical protein
VDVLFLEYLDGDKLYIPVDRLNLIQRYIGGDGKPPKLDKLGSGSWQRMKKRVKAAVSEMVKEILDLYAARRVFQGYTFPPLDQFYKEFEATFEYEETPDQIQAIEEVMEDIALSVGSLYVSEKTGEDMSRLTLNDLGKVEKVIVGANSTVLVGGNKDINKVNTRISELEENITLLKNKGEKNCFAEEFQTDQDNK